MDALFKKVSIGIMAQGEYGSYFERIADIEDEEIVKFTQDPSISPSRFQNRTHIYVTGEHPLKGELGIWKWKARPDFKDSTKDFVTSYWIKGAGMPFEIIKVYEAYTITQLIDLIKKGIYCDVNSCNIIFIIDSPDESHYEGICCYNDTLCFGKNNHFVTFKQGITEIPCIVIGKDEMVPLKNTVKGTFISLYKYFSLPQNLRFIPIKDLDEITIKVLRDRCTWAACKEKGLTKNEYQHMKDYIDELPVESMYQEIANQAKITPKEAEEIAHKKIDLLASYFAQTDQEDLLLDNIILSHDELKSRFKNLLQVQVQIEWEKENADKIKTAQDKLMQFQRESDMIQTKLHETKEQYKKLKSGYEKKKQTEEENLARIQEEIAQREEYNVELTNQVQLTIEEAQNHAAEFMAKWVVNSSLNQMNTKSINTPNRSLLHEGLPASEIEEDTSWEETRDRLDGNLYEIGAADKWSLPLATLFYALSKTNAPILLVGPCTDAIADAISCSLYGRFADVLTLDSSTDMHFIQELENKEPSIIRVDGVLDNNALTYATKLLKDKSHQYIFTHPFVEDLRLLPISLLNYIQVLFTEPFIDMQNNTPQLVGGMKSTDFQDISWFQEKALDSWPSLMLNTPPLFSAHLQELQKQMDSMRKKSEPFNQAIALGIYLPCFYMLDRPEALANEEFSKLGLDFDLWIKRLWGENR